MKNLPVGVDASDLLVPPRGIRIYSENLIFHFEKIGLKVLKFYALSRLIKQPSNILKATGLGNWGGVIEGTLLIGRKPALFHGLRGRAVKMSNGPVIITLHDLYGPGKSWLATALKIGINGIITPSRFVKDEILKEYPHLPPDSIQPIHMGIDHRLFHPRSPEECGPVLKKHGLKWKKYWVFVGSTTDPRKNFENIRKAAKMAGIELYAPRGAPHRELACIVAGAFGLVFATLGEGFGLPPIEAMACGTPVVASRKGSIPEIVGDAAIYVDNPLDPRSIAASIEKLRTDEALRIELIEKGLKRASMFSWDKTTQETIEFYHKVLSGETEILSLTR